MNITGNDLTDQAAKKRTKLQQLSSEKYMFLFYVKRKIKKSALSEWQEEYIKTNKGKFYSQFECFSR